MQSTIVPAALDTKPRAVLRRLLRALDLARKEIPMIRFILAFFAATLICLNLSGCGSDNKSKNLRYKENQKVQISANAALAHFNLGDNYLNKGDFENAIIHFRKSANLEPSKPDVWSALAQAYYLDGEKDEAEKYWLKALEISPRDVISLNGIALLYSKTKREEHAIEVYKKSLEIAPNNDSTNWNLAQFYLAKGKYQEAINALNIVIKHTPFSDLKNSAQEQLDEVKKRID